MNLKYFLRFLVGQDAAMLHMQDQSGALPIHMACHADAPIEVIRFLVQQDASTLHVKDGSGALPIHIACRLQLTLGVVRLLVTIPYRADRVTRTD